MSTERQDAMDVDNALRGLDTQGTFTGASACGLMIARALYNEAGDSAIARFLVHVSYLRAKNQNARPYGGDE